MNIQLYIEDELVDVKDDILIPLNYSISDVKEYYNKNSNFSKDFKLPDTPKNREIFRRLFNINVIQNFWNVEKVKSVLYVNDYEIFRGYISLKDIIYENGFIEYECSLYSTLKGLFYECGNKELYDLTWSDSYKHLFNINTINNNTYNSDVLPYFYGFFDFGLLIEEPNENSTLLDKINNFSDIEKGSFFRPAIFIKSLIDKIFEEYGYTYECDLFNKNWFKNLCIPHCNDKFTYSTTNTLSILDINRDYLYDPIQTRNRWEILKSSKTYDLYNKYNTSSGIYTINNSTTIRLTTNLTGTTHEIVDNNVELRYRIQIQNSSGGIKFDKIYNNVDGAFSSIDTFEVVQDDKIYIYYTTVGTVGNAGSISGFTLNITDLKEPEEVVWNSTEYVTPKDIVPRGVKQRDFLISIFKLFNIYLDIDEKNEKNYILKVRDKYYYDGKIQDWSEKIVKNLQIKNDIITTEYNKLLFKYKDDNDYHNKYYRDIKNRDYGSIEITTNNIYSNDEGDIDIIFSPTPFITNSEVQFENSYWITHYSSGCSNYIKAPVARLSYSNDTELNPTTIGTYLKKGKYKHNPRILLKHNVNSIAEGQYDIQNYSTALSFDFENKYYDTEYQGYIDLVFRNEFNNYKTYIDCNSDEINIGEFNLNTFWLNTNINNISINSRILTAYFNLSPKDIFNTKLNDLIYVNLGDDLGDGWFIINKIIDYDFNSQITKVELLKIIDPSSLGLNRKIRQIVLDEQFLIDGGIDTIGNTYELIDGGIDTIGNTYELIDGGINSII